MKNTDWYKNNAHRLYRRGWIEWRHIGFSAMFGIAMAALVYLLDPVFHIPSHNWLGHLNIALLVGKAAADGAIYSASRRHETPQWNWYDVFALLGTIVLSTILLTLFICETNSDSEHEKYFWTNYNLATRFTSIGDIFRATEVQTDYRVFRYIMLTLSSVTCPLFILFQ